MCVSIISVSIKWLSSYNAPFKYYFTDPIPNYPMKKVKQSGVSTKIKIKAQQLLLFLFAYGKP